MTVADLAGDVKLTGPRIDSTGRVCCATTMKHPLPFMSVLAISATACVAIWLHSTNSTSATTSSISIVQETPPTAPARGAGDNIVDMGTRLVNAMKSVEGCNDAVAAQVQDGRAVIFGWFENKAAVMNWYNHPMHAGMRRASGIKPGADYEPMASVPDDVPVMAVACLQFEGPPAVEGGMIPFSAISIELYQPLTGGLRINGGFAPEGWADGDPDAPSTQPAN